MCVCVRERERGREIDHRESVFERERGGEIDRKRDRESVCEREEER